MNFLPAHLQQTVLQLALVLGVSLGWGGGTAHTEVGVTGVSLFWVQHEL